MSSTNNSVWLYFNEKIVQLQCNKCDHIEMYIFNGTSKVECIECGSNNLEKYND